MTQLSNIQLSELKDFAQKAAILAGEYIQSQFDQHYDKQHKEGGDSLASQVVTEVDIRAQEIILEVLEESIIKYDLGLLTEEQTDDQSRLNKSYFWCIDPMDGTLPFTEKRTGYAVSISLLSRAGDPVVGVVYIPDLEECYTAIKGAGITLNAQTLQRKELPDDIIHIYMDRSFRSESYYELVRQKLEEFAAEQSKQIAYHDDFGGVRNAIGVLVSPRGAYFKFPKLSKGCGSIWDYAATRLFFEEMNLLVSTAQGDRLNLNNPQTTFMNQGGILFATDVKLVEFVKSLGSRLT